MGCGCKGAKLPQSVKQQAAADPAKRPPLPNTWNGPKPKAA